MQSWVEDALDEAVPKIKALIRECRTADDSQMKSTMASIKQVLLDTKLATVVKVPCQGVLVHHQNRFGAGVDVKDVHSILDDISSTGWDWDMLGVPICFELPSGAVGEKALAWNEKLVESAGGFLAPVDRQRASDMSVSASHRVAALRCVLAGARHEGKPDHHGNSDKLTHNGKLSLEKCLQVCPSFKEALEGFPWCRVKREVADALPDLPSFFSEACNAGHGIAKEHTKTQVLIQIHQKASHNYMSTGEYHWDKVAAAIERTHIPLQGQVKEMAAYVAQWSGGVVPVFLEELDAFAKALPHRKDISPQSLGLLAQVQLAQCPEYITSCVMAMLAAPASFTVNGVSTLLTGADVHAIAEKHKKACIEATKLIRQARRWTASAGMSEGDIIKVMGDMQVRMVMHIHGKKVRGRKTYKSLEEIASHLVQDACQVADLTRASLPAAPFAALPESQGTPAAREGTSMRSFVSGDLEASSLPAAMKLGATVCKRGEDDKFVIKAVDESTATLTDASGAESTVPASQLLDEFQLVVTTAPDVRHVSDLSDPLRYQDLVNEAAKSEVRLAMHELFRSEQSNVDVSFQLKPRRAVFANKHYPAGKLVLVPLSPNLHLTSGTVPVNAVNFGVVATGRSDAPLSAFVAPKVEEPKEKAESFVVAFWMVRRVEGGLANMKESTRTVKVSADQGSKAHATTIEVPVLVNSSAIEKNQEICAPGKSDAAPAMLDPSVHGTSSKKRPPAAGSAGQKKGKAKR